MKVMLDNCVEHTTPRRRVYSLGSIPAKGGGVHVVALVLGDQGTAVAAVSSSLLCEDFPSATGILMVGIAGGVPDVGKAERHVRLGDIVASGEHGVIAYDFVKEHPDKFEPRHPPRPPHPELYRACRRLSANAATGDSPWLSFLSRAAHLPLSARPGVETDILASSTDHQIQLSHPHDPARRIGEPRVFLGTIACANRLLKNPVKRDQLRDQFDVRAVEMEGFGIAEATWNQSIGYLVVRGICDYCDKNKGDDWQGHAAVIAAAYARSVLQETPPARSHSQPAAPPPAPNTDEELRELAKALLQAGTPRSVSTLLSDSSSEAKRALDQLGAVRRSVTSIDKKRTIALTDLPDGEVRHQFVAAPPGSGKTHALWRLGQQMLAAGEQIPLYIPIGLLRTWKDALDVLAGPTGIDPRVVLRNARVCLMLDGWAEFQAQASAADNASALRDCYAVRVIATGRRDPDYKADFAMWFLEPLPVSVVTAAIRTATPNPAPIDPVLGELLRLPLALSLYILLGGSACNRGQLLARFHQHLSRGFPPSFQRALTGAAAALALSTGGRTWSMLEEEIRNRTSSGDTSAPLELLSRLGTLEARSGMVSPVHDLYWSWLCGVGLLEGDRISATLTNLSTRESIDLALESGSVAPEAAVRTALDVDILLAASLARNLAADAAIHQDIASRIGQMLKAEAMVARVRGALAVLTSQNAQLLRSALDAISDARKSGAYVAEVQDRLDLEWLFNNRGLVADWVGSPGTDQLLDVIARRGEQHWSDWLSQMAHSSKISFADAVGVALACEPTIPQWTKPHLLAFIKEESYRLRAVALRGKNRQLALWLVDNYAECIECHQSAFYDIDQVFVACADDQILAHLLSRFPLLPKKAQEVLGYALTAIGDPWLGRFQAVAFSAAEWSHHHELLEKASTAVDDQTARQWIEHGPAVLGWRVLATRHGNSIVPELVSRLPDSFDGLHLIPALEAMEYLKAPPDTLTGEIWKRVRGTMQPRAMADVLFALATVTTSGLPSMVAQLAGNPSFLPLYHLVLFMRLLREWQSKTGLSLNASLTNGRQVPFLDWLLGVCLQKHRSDTSLGSMLGSIREIAVPVILAGFEGNEREYVKLLEACGGRVPYYDDRVVRYLLDKENGPKVIFELFSPCLGAFPEEVLIGLLDANGVELSTYVRHLAASGSPVHRTLHAKVIRRTLDSPFDEGLHRYTAQLVSVHPRNSLMQLVNQTIKTNVAADLWLIREIERASGQLLIGESGVWLS